MNLHIVALFRFRENYLMDAIELFKKLVAETRKEEGCLQYDLVEDYENKGVFLMIELWESHEHYLQHDVSDHLRDFRNQSRAMLEDPIQVYKGTKIF
ncbi:putative quinol monooxygenase [Chryseobacterium koreense]|uniref:Antibiotic biosynthesis monooxygenase n=1 Tax=Chryseobacterium koreense CCUG 49689 TaxID=1304281 RepID=A0A0J7IYM3_9FLAO|nr:putative quinol monooxygenase [Chryseobacterium koreense]KMQ70914.1 antibiotic biosynthesis monooxygenase [Chryseobacterium koreense CCUG 49689]MBB5332425.1 quinol monooxygenase YgiN [Chryseobacterium koreense]